MFDATNLKQNVSDFEKAPQFDGFTRVVIEVSDDVEYSAGTETGRTLTLYSPWATQQTALDILAKIKNFRYQPYRAKGAFIDPAAELGDGITIDGLYSGIYAEDINFGPLFSADVAAPFEEEINHEYQFVPEKERRVQRSLKNLSSSLTVQAGKIEAEVTERKESDEEIKGTLTTQAEQISAKVEKTGSNDTGSFGWLLDKDSWTISANNTEILKATKDGLDVTGRITAISGKIGGFDIINNHISSNNLTWGNNTITSGVYIGTEGIQLGSKTNGFHVDNSGNLYATNGRFKGWVEASSVDFGGDAGYFDGQGIEQNSIWGGQDGELDIGTVEQVNTDSYVSDGISGGLYADDVFNGISTAPYISCNSLATGALGVGGYDIELSSIVVNGVTHYVLKWK